MQTIKVKRPGIVNAMENDGFNRAVKATGRKRLFLAGVTTEICVTFAKKLLSSMLGALLARSLGRFRGARRFIFLGFCCACALLCASGVHG